METFLNNHAVSNVYCQLHVRLSIATNSNNACDLQFNDKKELADIHVYRPVDNDSSSYNVDFPVPTHSYTILVVFKWQHE